MMTTANENRKPERWLLRFADGTYAGSPLATTRTRVAAFAGVIEGRADADAAAATLGAAVVAMSEHVNFGGWRP